MYGMTVNGGINDYGVIFKNNADGTDIQNYMILPYTLSPNGLGQ